MMMSMPGSMSNIPNLSGMPMYDGRQTQQQQQQQQQQIHHEMFTPNPKAVLPNESYLGQQPSHFQPQINVVQRITGIVKSQLSFLQSAMHFVDMKTK